MEVTPEEAAQAVLLEGMEGTQFITIHRADGESLGKGIPLFTLNGDLLPEGMVVDLMNADVGAEYSSTAQYYETADLLAPDITEEDQRLTAALVAVQIQQQQKQQMQPNDNSTLSDVVQLQNLEPVDIYSVNTIPGTNPGGSYSSLPAYKHEEDINFKCEGDGVEISEDAITTPGLKRSLPHKKRIPRKLKEQEKTSSSEVNKSPEISADTTNGVETAAFRCELCGNKFTNQLKFFEHLKAHYEPLKKETPVKPVENRDNLKPVQTTIQVENNVVEEFSESEDLMEGIRGVVEQTGAHIDFETDNPLPVTNALTWPSAEEIESLENIANNPVPMEDLDLQSRLNLYIPKQAPPAKSKSKPKRKPKKKPKPAPPPKEKKKSKAQRMREEQTCKHCNRYFNHKNSLIYHMRSHSGERPHQCEVCGKSFFAASALKVHKRLHSGDKPYTCEDCGRKFRQWGDLKYHSTSLHSELRQFQCEYCGKDFARKYSLIVHRRIHTGEKNYRCEYCNKTFRASSYLQNHRKIHTGEKPHPCTICGKPFRVRSDMKRHMLTHTREKTERAPNKSSAKSKIQEDVGALPAKPRTIQDLVQELKLEVEPESIGRYEPVTLVAPEENHESILPHESANLEFATQNNPVVVGRELETTIRNADNFQYHLFI